MEAILTYKGSVMPIECDTNGHMNIMYYVNKYEHAARNFFHTVDGLNTLIGGNIGLVVLEQNIQYQKEVFADDILYIKSELTSFGNKAITVKHTMYDGKTNVMVSNISVVSVLLDKVKRKAVTLSNETKDSLGLLLN